MLHELVFLRSHLQFGSYPYPYTFASYCKVYNHTLRLRYRCIPRWYYPPLLHWCSSNASINSKREYPPGQPPGFCTYFQPWSRTFVPSELPGVGPIIKVPRYLLMPHEGTFQLQTDLPSIAAL